jgi:ribose 5-phosphate isomerase A
MGSRMNWGMDWEASIQNICNYLKDINILEEGDTIGIGTGRTIKRLVTCLDIKSIKAKTFVSSSFETMLFLKTLGIRSVHPASIDELDVYIDSADYATRNLELIKGGGAALTTEKLLASASKKVIIAIDQGKLINNILGKPIPLEVIPEAVSIVKKKLSFLGLRAVEREPASGKRLPVISDTGGAILDLDASQWSKSPRELEDTLKRITGIVETGLFLDLVDILIIGYPQEVQVYRKR